MSTEYADYLMLANFLNFLLQKLREMEMIDKDKSDELERLIAKSSARTGS